MLEPEARILECRSLSRLGPCLPEIAHRLFSELASKGVIGEPLDFGYQAIGIECLDRGNDTPMKLTPPIAQKPMICDVDCGHVLANDRGNMQEALVLRGQSIDARGQDRMHGSGNLDGVNGLGKVVASAL